MSPVPVPESHPAPSGAPEGRSGLRPETADHAQMMRLVEQLSPETRTRIAQRLDDRFHEITGTPREETDHA